MQVIAYDDLVFRALFPPYENCELSVLHAFWETATAYVSDVNGGCYTGGMTLAQRRLALNQMTAHLLFLNGVIASGNTPGVTTGATIDKVSVTLQPPPAPNQWQYWLNQSPYGQQLLALLQLASVGGFYASSAIPGRAGFRFGNGW